MMQLIEQQTHFWELYRADTAYYLSIAVDMSSVVSCWDLILTHEEIQGYEHRGKVSIQELAESLVATAYKGDFSDMESRLARPYERQAIQKAFKSWRLEQSKP